MYAPSTDEEAGVITLTDDSFEEFIKQNKYVLVEFYAPWCGHCQKLVPEWQKAAYVLKSSLIPVPLAKVDVTVQKALGTIYDIKGFPTLKFFEQGKPVEYLGGRTGEDIVKWVQKKTGDYSRLVTDSASLQQYKDDNKVIVAYFTTETSGKEWEIYEKVAKEYEKLFFIHIQDKNLMEQENVTSGSVVLYKNFDEKINILKKITSEQELIKFIDVNQIATVMEFDDIGVQAVFFKRNPTLFFFHSETPESNSLKEVFIQAAAQNKEGELKYAITSPNDGHGQWQQLAGYLRVDTKDAPFVMFVHATPQEVKKQKMEKPISLENLQKFIEQYNIKQNKAKHDDL